MFKLILCLTVALKLASSQENGIIWNYNPPAPYFRPTPQILPEFSSQYRGASEAPVLGSPLLPLGIIPRPFPFGIPGMRFSNMNSGRIGGLMHSNLLLGSPNPMAEGENSQMSGMEHLTPQNYQQQYLPEPQIAAQQDPEAFGHKIFWKHWANPEEQHGPMVSATPSCEQSYYQPAQVAAPLPYHPTYDVASPQNPAYQPSYANNYQAYHQHQPHNQWYSAKSSDIQPQQPQQSPSELIVQPEGLYDEKSATDGKADERSWDWHWDKDKKDKFDKKDKYDKKGHDKGHGKDFHKVYYKGMYTVPVHHEPVYHNHHHHQGHTPVYTKPAPMSHYGAYAQPQYNNYHGQYRSNDFVAGRSLDSSKTEVATPKDELKITTTEAPTNKTSTTVTCITKNDVSTKSISTTSKVDDKDLTSLTTTTEKTDKSSKDDKAKPKRSSRQQRSIHNGSPTAKRCISFSDPMFFGLPILGAPNPRADESDSKQDLQSTPSEKSESERVGTAIETEAPPIIAPTPKSPFAFLQPEKVQQVFQKTIEEPYLGAVRDENKKLWNNGALMGQIIGPVEDTYLEFVKHHQNMPQIQNVRIIT